MNERSDLLNNEAIKLSHSGLYTEAIACFKRAITIDKENYLLWFNLGLTFREAGLLKKALMAFEKARELPDGDKNEDVTEALAVTYFDTGDYDSALETCENGLEENSMNPQFWNTRGAIYFNQGNLTEAQESFEAAVIINPYFAEALYNLRDTYKELKNESGYQECINKINQLKTKLD